MSSQWCPVSTTPQYFFNKIAYSISHSSLFVVFLDPIHDSKVLIFEFDIGNKQCFERLCINFFQRSCFIQNNGGNYICRGSNGYSEAQDNVSIVVEDLQVKNKNSIDILSS